MRPYGGGRALSEVLVENCFDGDADVSGDLFRREATSAAPTHALADEGVGARVGAGDPPLSAGIDWTSFGGAVGRVSHRDAPLNQICVSVCLRQESAKGAVAVRQSVNGWRERING